VVVFPELGLSAYTNDDLFFPELAGGVTEVQQKLRQRLRAGAKVDGLPGSAKSPH
jgi:predicted amidohydrolase